MEEETKKNNSLYLNMNLNAKSINEFEVSLKNIQNAKIVNKKNHQEYRQEKIFELGLDYESAMKIGEFEKAIGIAKKLTFFEKDNPEFYLLLANAYIKLFDVSSAITCFKKYCSMNKFDDAQKKKLELLLFSKGIHNLECGKVDRKLFSDAKDASVAGGTNNYFNYLKALSLLAAGDKTAAIMELKQVLLNDDTNTEALLLLGKIYLSLGKVVEGSIYLWRLHKLKPEHSEIKQYVSIMRNKMHECINKANENVLRSKLDMALLWAIKGLNIYPNHPECLLLRSAIYRKIGKYNESLTDLDNASKNKDIDGCSSKVYKQISLTYNELGLYLLNTKNYIEAIKFFNESIKFANDDVAIHINKGDCLREQKFLNKALEEYFICKKIDPNNGEVNARISIIYYKFAVLCFNNKDYDESLRNLNAAIEYCKNSSEFFVFRARVYLKLKRAGEAYNDCNIALKINPNNLDAQEVIGFLTK